MAPSTFHIHLGRWREPLIKVGNVALGLAALLALPLVSPSVNVAYAACLGAARCVVPRSTPCSDPWRELHDKWNDLKLAGYLFRHHVHIKAAKFFVRGRPLNEEERREFHPIFERSLAFSKVKLRQLNFPERVGGSAMGNELFFPKGDIPREKLAHELLHVWQRQNGGAFDEDGWEVYPRDYESRIRKGARWEDLGHEEQAWLFTDMYASGFFQNNPRSRFLTDPVLRPAAEDAAQQIQAGTGAANAKRASRSSGWNWVQGYAS
jgi:hypothetical protein